MSPLTHLISQIGHESEEGNERANVEEESDKSQGSRSTAEIQGRVKNAIRNSLKLINGLKYRESQVVK